MEIEKSLDTELFTVKDVAKMLKISEGSIYRLIKEKRLKAIKITPKAGIRITKEDLLAYIQEQKNESDKD